LGWLSKGFILSFGKEEFLEKETIFFFQNASPDGKVVIESGHGRKVTATSP
jgi:hypothetical protein